MYTFSGHDNININLIYNIDDNIFIYIKFLKYHYLQIGIFIYKNRDKILFFDRNFIVFYLFKNIWQ